MKDYSPEAFKLTTTLLDLNPEFYTVWNYRRDILVSGPGVTDEQYGVELKFTQAQLRKVPKCYWVWNHRQWCFETNPAPDWRRELKTVDKLLDLDARNFHGWHYRRYVIAGLEKAEGHSLALSEFDYTTKLINKNFSNYSALHNRSKLIEKIFEEPPKVGEPHHELFSSREIFLLAELEYFKNAMYTDPDDQSIWLYIEWLLTAPFFTDALSVDRLVEILRLQISDIDELNELEKEDNHGIDNKWCLKIKGKVQMQLLKVTNDKSLEQDLRQGLEHLVLADPKRKNRYQEILNARS